MGLSSRWLAVAVLLGTSGAARADQPRVRLMYEKDDTVSPLVEVVVRAVPPAGVEVTEVTIQLGDGKAAPMRPGPSPTSTSPGWR